MKFILRFGSLTNCSVTAFSSAAFSRRIKTSCHQYLTSDIDCNLNKKGLGEQALGRYINNREPSII